MIARDKAELLYGATVLDVDGKKVGPVGHVFVDESSDALEWIVVSTRFMGVTETFVPLDEATFDPADKSLQVPYDSLTIKDAPQVPIDRNLTPENEQLLYSYYRLPYSTEHSATGLPTDTGQAGLAGGRTHVRSVEAWSGGGAPRPLGGETETVAPGTTSTGGGATHSSSAAVGGPQSARVEASLPAGTSSEGQR